MSARFGVQMTSLEGVCVVERFPRSDERGWLERLYCASELADLLGSRTISQVNRSSTRVKGTVRGMHYQVSPSAETKIVTCLRGAIHDVAVDLRRGSPSFLRWHAETLREGDHRSLVVPEGFAHGFQALTDDAEVLYLTTAAYDPEAERGLNPRDPRLAIAWPLPVTLLSERDAARAPVDPSFDGIVV